MEWLMGESFMRSRAPFPPRNSGCVRVIAYKWYCNKNKIPQVAKRTHEGFREKMVGYMNGNHSIFK